MRPLVTLTTDFGTGSAYVAQIKGVILSLCREVELVDLSHAIGPQNVREGAVVLADATPRFPAETLHLVVVDPGVGTARKIVFAQIGEQRYLAPDNGLLSLVAARQAPRQIVALENPRYWLERVSPTFHGRDVMAPAAAHLAAGVDPVELGSTQEALLTLDWPEARRSSGGIEGEVLYVDSFGNLITNIEDAALADLGQAASLMIECGGHQIRGIVPTYGAAMARELVGLVDSQGRLEIALVGGSAARELRIEPGEAVVVSSSN